VEKDHKSKVVSEEFLYRQVVKQSNIQRDEVRNTILKEAGGRYDVELLAWIFDTYAKAQTEIGELGVGFVPTEVKYLAPSEGLPWEAAPDYVSFGYMDHLSPEYLEHHLPNQTRWIELIRFTLYYVDNWLLGSEKLNEEFQSQLRDFMEGIRAVGETPLAQMQALFEMPLYMTIGSFLNNEITAGQADDPVFSVRSILKSDDERTYVLQQEWSDAMLIVKATLFDSAIREAAAIEATFKPTQ
jgi:hypothetical protein